MLRAHPESVMNDLNTLASLGYTLPSPAYLFGLILFGITGYAAYRYGRKAGLTKPKWIGVALMLYPYVVSETWVLYGVGVSLCVALYVYRKHGPESS
jgi:hypothetical protein